jgi:hypothetical protein
MIDLSYFKFRMCKKLGVWGKPPEIVLLVTIFIIFLFLYIFLPLFSFSIFHIIIIIQQGLQFKLSLQFYHFTSSM